MKDEDLKGALENFAKASELSEEPAPTLHARVAELELRSGNIQKAYDESSKAVAADPENTSLQLLHGGILEALDKNDEAEALYLKAIDSNPKGTDPYVLLAGLYSKKSEHQKAITLLTKLVTKSPNDPVGHYYLGRTYESINKLPLAEKHMRSALSQQPTNPGIAIELVRVLLKEQKVEDAKTLCQKILAKDPDNVVARKVLGQMAIGENHFDEALKHLQVLEKVEGDATDTRFKIALIEIERRDFDEALRELNLVLAKKPDFGQARYYLGSVLAGTGKVREAIEELLKINKGDEAYERSRMFAAFLMKQEKDLDGAERAIKEAMEGGDKRQLTVYLVSILRDSGKLTEAIDVIDESIKEDPKNEKLLFTKGLVLHDLGREADSLETMEEVLKLNSQNSDALNYVAYGLAEQGGDLARALSLIEKALVIKPNDGYYIDTKGWVYYHMESYAKAVETLARAVDLVSDDMVVIEHYGDALLKAGKNDKAVDVFRKALSQGKAEEKEKVELEKRIRQKLADLGADPAEEWATKNP